MSNKFHLHLTLNTPTRKCWVELRGLRQGQQVRKYVADIQPDKYRWLLTAYFNDVAGPVSLKCAPLDEICSYLRVHMPTAKTKIYDERKANQ